MAKVVAYVRFLQLQGMDRGSLLLFGLGRLFQGLQTIVDLPEVLGEDCNKCYSLGDL